MHGPRIRPDCRGEGLLRLGNDGEGDGCEAPGGTCARPSRARRRHHLDAADGGHLTRLQHHDLRCELAELGVELVQDESLPGIRVARGADRVVITEVDANVDGRTETFNAAMSNVSNPIAEHPPEAAFDGNPKTGWAEATYNDNPKVMLALRFAQPVHTEAGSVMTVRLHHDSEYRRAVTGRFRLSLSSGEYPWPGVGKGKEISDAALAGLRNPEEKRTPQQRAAICLLEGQGGVDLHVRRAHDVVKQIRPVVREDLEGHPAPGAHAHALGMGDGPGRPR